MKWDRLLAYGLVVCGVAYASYSAISYYQKLDVVKEIDPTPKASAHASAQAKEKTNQNSWVIYSAKERPIKGEHFADLVIPRLKAQMPVIEGTDEDELAQGVGHYAGSVLPGEPDNAVLSGHRDTIFRKIGQLKPGDELHVKTSRGTFVYVIDKTWITHADDRTVIVPHDQPTLTLTTCYPFYYIGPAPKRYIIQSTLKERIH
ncbi:class D sortase [Thermoflavimicrobium dichotomicum]|uniref:Sortase A n=1 Tax=Thermoflavimicrobium dichotomicum TaxID=46223 RepID=A0A1I3LW68_9BACL|nr:class D sortase [Thermoflavimicrobium dichotomicum]SFI88933.1 sortase A [Thermoflavimicrobium dichotomicum]